MEFKVDARALHAFGEDLAIEAKRLDPKVRAVVKKGALNIKKTMQEDLGGSKSFKGVRPAVNFTMSGNANFSQADIGPVKGSPGSLANIAYFGTSRGGGTVDVENGLKQEAPRFEKALRDVIGDV